MRSPGCKPWVRVRPTHLLPPACPDAHRHPRHGDRVRPRRGPPRRRVDLDRHRPHPRHRPRGAEGAVPRQPGLSTPTRRRAAGVDAGHADRVDARAPRAAPHREPVGGAEGGRGPVPDREHVHPAPERAGEGAREAAPAGPAARDAGRRTDRPPAVVRQAGRRGAGAAGRGVREGGPGRVLGPELRLPGRVEAPARRRTGLPRRPPAARRRRPRRHRRPRAQRADRPERADEWLSSLSPCGRGWPRFAAG